MIDRAALRSAGRPNEQDILDVLGTAAIQAAGDGHAGHDHAHRHPPDGDYDLKLQLALARRCC